MPMIIPCSVRCPKVKRGYFQPCGIVIVHCMVVIGEFNYAAMALSVTLDLFATFTKSSNPTAASSA